MIRTYDLRITGAVTTTFTQNGITASIKWTETYRRLRISFRQRTLRVNFPRWEMIVSFGVILLNRTRGESATGAGEIVETASVRAADCAASRRSRTPATGSLGYHDHPPNFSVSTFRDRANRPPCRGNSWSPEGVVVKKSGGLSVIFAGATGLLWNYKARQRLGRLAFPLNQLVAGKSLTIAASGSSFENYPSAGWVRAVFTPRA